VHSLSICRTCPRDQSESGLPGDELLARLRPFAEREGIQLLRVACLGACRQPCSVALDAPEKPRLRFSGLRAQDSAAIEELMRRYRLSAEGLPDATTIPASLRAALTAVSPKHRAQPIT
jgi:predicted metal-binding protein